MFNLNSIIRPNILALKAYSSARDEYKGSEGIFLDANENPFGSLNRYPDPNQLTLKSMLAERSAVKKENVFIGNGSDELIDLVYTNYASEVNIIAHLIDNKSSNNGKLRNSIFVHDFDSPHVQ